MRRCQENQHGEDGFALVIVLGFLMLFAVFLTPFATSARLQVLISGNEFQRQRLDSSAQAINDFLNWRVASDNLWRQAVERGDIDSVMCADSGFELTIRMLPHAKLINLNTAEAPLIESGLIRLGFDSGSASDSASDIVAFRSPRGADGDGDGISSGFKRAPFEDISEMHDFVALSELPISLLAKVFSVWSGQSISSTKDQGIGSSRHFTLASRLVTKGNVGSDAAVYAAGGATTTKSRIATISQDMGSEAVRREMTCDALLGPSGALVLEGVAG